MKKNIFPCCILLKEKLQGYCSGPFSKTDEAHTFTSEFIPCKVKTLVSKKAQCELQTREQEEVAKINQAQHLKLLHSCKENTCPASYQSFLMLQKCVKKK